MNLISVFLIFSAFMPGPFKTIRALQKEYYAPEYVNKKTADFNPWTWNLVNLPGGEILGTFSNPNSQNLVFAISFRDVWRTTDGGANWGLSFENCMPAGGVLSTPQRGIVVDGGGVVWITLNSGNDWAEVLYTNDFQTASFDVADTVIYLVDSIPPRLWRSTNSGLSWQFLGTFNNLYNIDQITHLKSNPDVFWLTGHASPVDSFTYVYFSPSGTFVDTIVAGEVMDIQPNPYNPNLVLIATDNGIYQSTSASGPWTRINEPYVFGIFQAVDIEFTGNDTILVSSFINPGIFRGVRQYGIWIFNYVESREIATLISHAGSGTFYAGSLGKGVFKTTNNGLSWTVQRNNLYAHTIISPGAASCPSLDTVVYAIGLGGTIYRIKNYGTSFDTLMNFLLMGSAIESAPTNPNFIIASCIHMEISGTTFSMGTIFTSSDGGVNWTKVDSTYLPTDFLITSDPNVIIGLCDTFLIRSTTGGTNFTPVFAKPVSLSNLAGRDTIFVATYDSVFVSYDRGATWQFLTIDPGQETDEISYDNNQKILYLTDIPLYRYYLLTGTLDSIAINGYANFSTDVAPNGNLYFLYYGTDTIYIARSFDTGNTIEQEPFPIPHFFGGLLACNGALFYYEGGRRFWVSTDITHGVAENIIRENKFSFFVPTLVKKNSLAKISFAIDHSRTCSIKLYDGTGRLVKNIYEADFAPGIYNLEFSTKGLNSGVYFVRLNSEQEQRTRKFIVY
ncbi:MAG: T9SS type A sorting domain-containing protein [candidate division WOR-3 bacterium]